MPRLRSADLFLADFARAAVVFSTGREFIARAACIALTYFFTVNLNDHITVLLPNGAAWRPTVGVAIAWAVGCVWGSGCLGFAFARAHRSLLALGDAMVRDEVSLTFLLSVRNDGWGMAKARAYVRRVVKDGKDLQVAPPLPLQVTWAGPEP
jgi:hypothetical protein